MTKPRQIYFQASGLRVAALSWGPEEGPLALCLHGYPDTAWTWRHLGPELAQRGWRVVAPFLRGYGPTDLAPDGAYQVGALARDALEAHQALGGDERAVLIGHDWGAIAAYAAVGRSPQTFARAVTIAVPPLPVVLAPLLHPSLLAHRLPLVLRQLRCSWYVFFQQLPGISERLLPRIVRRLWADWSPGYDAREDLAHLDESLADDGRRNAALRYYRALLQPWYRQRTYRAEQRYWMAIPSVPVLYLHGQRDGCFLAALTEGAQEALPAGSRMMVLPSVGHFLQLEDPSKVNRLILDFLGQSPSDEREHTLAAR